MSDEKADTFEFDKFMDEIVVKEELKRPKREKEELTPQREYARRYRERPQNRIKFGE